MKKIILFFSALLVLTSSFASMSPVETPALKATSILFTIGKNGEKVSLMELSRMKVKDLQALTGKKMNFFDRIGFKLAQRDLQKSINYDGTLNKKKMNKLLKKAEGGSGFHIGGFALGFLLGLIGVLIAYLINDDKKSTRVKWSWIGFGVSLLLLILLLI